MTNEEYKDEIWELIKEVKSAIEVTKAELEDYPEDAQRTWRDLIGELKLLVKAYDH